MIKKHYIFLLLVTLMLSIPFASHAQDDSQILLYGGNQDISNIDPAVGEDYSNSAALRSLYDPLFIYRGNELEAHLVESWEVNDDATVWTFKLVENAVFHDGSPVNADAVVYTFNRIQAVNGPPNWRWVNISDENTAQKVDEFTVEFTLTKPFAPFIGTLAQFFVVNPAIVEENRINSAGEDDFAQEWMTTHAAGSGPFMQGERWEIGNIYEFVAVDDYWAGWSGDTHLDGFFWIIQRDGSTQVNSLLAGETHIADTPDATDIDRVDEMEGFRNEANPGFFINSLKMNNQGEYTSNIHVRKAIAYATNYDALPEVQAAPVVVLAGPTPLNFPGAVQDLEMPYYDLDIAREHLAQSPWPDGGFELDYVYVTDFPPEEVTGLVMLEGLAELNITMNMVPMLWPDMVASCGDPSTGPDLINIYTGIPFGDLHAHLYNQYHSDQWKSGAGTYNSCSFFDNPRVDELLSNAVATGDQEARTEMYDEAQRIIMEEQPSVFTYVENSPLFFNECVQGYVYSPFYPLTVLFQDLWLDGC